MPGSDPQTGDVGERQSDLAHDRISYTILPEDDVFFRRPTDSREDPAIGAFLSFLAQDIDQNPGRIRGLEVTLRAKLSALTDGVELDLDVA